MKQKLLQELQGRAYIKPADFPESPQNGPSTEIPRNAYFQTHFAHIHENVNDVQSEMKQLRQHVANLNVKMDKLTSMLIDQQALLLGSKYLIAQSGVNGVGH